MQKHTEQQEQTKIPNEFEINVWTSGDGKTAHIKTHNIRKEIICELIYRLLKGEKILLKPILTSRLNSVSKLIEMGYITSEEGNKILNLDLK